MDGARPYRFELFQQNRPGPGATCNSREYFVGRTDSGSRKDPGFLLRERGGSECQDSEPGIKKHTGYSTETKGHQGEGSDDATSSTEFRPSRCVTKIRLMLNRHRCRHCEHWLNGEKVVEHETESGPIESPILLQHHGSDVWFRNIRIRRLQ